MKKYELTNVACYCTYDRKTPVLLHRIRALADFGDVKAGDLGGWIEKEYNLSQNDTCWVYNDAMVFDNAAVRENAVVRDNAKIYEYAYVYGNSSISQQAKVHDHTSVSDCAVISGSAELCGITRVYSQASVRGHALLIDTNAFGTAKIFGKAYLKNCVVNSNAVICGNAHIESPTDNCDVFIGDNADIRANNHVFVTWRMIMNGNSCVTKTITFYKNKTDDIFVGIPYNGGIITLKEFEDVIEKCEKPDRESYKETIKKVKKQMGV